MPQLTVIQQSVLQHIPRLNLPADARVLDAPCGAPAALTLALEAKGFSVIGADLDETAALTLGKAFARVDLNAPLPWPDDSFDLAISTEGIEHLENHFTFFREFLARAPAKWHPDRDNTKYHCSAVAGTFLWKWFLRPRCSAAERVRPPPAPPY